MTHGEDTTKKIDDINPTEIESLFDDVEKGAVGKADKRLSRGKVSTDCRNEKGMTPLIKASAAGNASFVGMLIGHKADVNAVDTHGYTALMAAASNGHIDVVKDLVSSGADLEIRNKENLTASEVAAETGFPEIVTYLSLQQASSSTATETSEEPDDDGPATYGAAGASLSFAPDDDEPPTGGPAGAATGAAMIASPESLSYVRELDLESIPEPGRSAYFKPHQEPELATENWEHEAAGAPEDDNPDSSDASPGTGSRKEDAWNKIVSAVNGPIRKPRVAGPAVPEDVLAANEERIVFDALDHKLVQSVNENFRKILNKAFLEFGDHTVEFRRPTTP